MNKNIGQVEKLMQILRGSLFSIFTVLQCTTKKLFTVLLFKAVEGKIDLDLLKYTRAHALAQYPLIEGNGIILFYCYDLNTGLVVLCWELVEIQCSMLKAIDDHTGLQQQSS